MTIQKIINLLSKYPPNTECLQSFNGFEASEFVLRPWFGYGEENEYSSFIKPNCNKRGTKYLYINGKPEGI